MAPPTLDSFPCLVFLSGTRIDVVRQCPLSHANKTARRVMSRCYTWLITSHCRSRSVGVHHIRHWLFRQHSGRIRSTPSGHTEMIHRLTPSIVFNFSSTLDDVEVITGEYMGIEMFSRARLYERSSLGAKSFNIPAVKWEKHPRSARGRTSCAK